MSVLAASLAAFAPSAHAVRDYAPHARNIIPSGQYGGVPPVAQADRQARMYDALTPLFDKVTPTHLRPCSSPSGSAPRARDRSRRERAPHKGLRILRDRFNVPHIYGRTNDDVTWGAGWALAHDRELLLEQARYNARVAVVDAPGQTAIDLIVGLKTFVPSAQTEARGAEGGRRSCRPTGSRAAGCCTTSTSSSRASTPTTRPRAPPTSPGRGAT